MENDSRQLSSALYSGKRDPIRLDPPYKRPDFLPDRRILHTSLLATTCNSTAQIQSEIGVCETSENPSARSNRSLFWQLCLRFCVRYRKPLVRVWDADTGPLQFPEGQSADGLVERHRTRNRYS